MTPRHGNGRMDRFIAPSGDAHNGRDHLPAITVVQGMISLAVFVAVVFRPGAMASSAGENEVGEGVSLVDRLRQQPGPGAL